jgi:iron complex transport system permease protein
MPVFGLHGFHMVAPHQIGSALTMALLLLFVGRSGNVITFILAGVILSSFAGALTALLISLAPNPYAISEIITWLMGALTDRSMNDVMLALPFMIIGSALLFSAGRSLDALSLGEDTARSLGVDMARLQWIIVAGVGLAVGAAVSVTGVIGFVGLVVPHLLRPFFVAQPSKLLLPSALAGASLLLFADSAVRWLPGASELKLGVAMALIGAPFFLALLLHSRKRAL